MLNMRKKITIIICIILLLMISVFKYSDDIELFYYSLITGNSIDRLELGHYSLIAVKEEKDHLSYFIFLKRKNKVIKSEYYEVNISNERLEKMIDQISHYYDDYTIHYALPHLRTWTSSLNETDIKSNLYYYVSLENDEIGYRSLDLSFFDDTIYFFDGYETVKLQ